MEREPFGPGVGDDTGMVELFKKSIREEFENFFSGLDQDLGRKDFTEEEIGEILEKFKDIAQTLYDFYCYDPVGFDNVAQKALSELEKIKNKARSDNGKELISQIEKILDGLMRENRKTSVDQ